MTRYLRRSLAAVTVFILALIIPDNASASPGIFPAPATGLLWLYKGTGPDRGTLSQWNLHGTNVVSGPTIWAMKCDYTTECKILDEFAGIGELDGNPGYDLLTRESYASGAGRVVLHTDAKATGASHWFGGCDSACQNRPIGMRDFNKDGHQDVLWYSPGSAYPVITMFNGAGVSWQSVRVQEPCGFDCAEQWVPVGVGDVNSDGFHDLLWWDIKPESDGYLHAWLLNASGQLVGKMNLSWRCPDACRYATWKPVGLGDINGDGTQDLMWRNSDDGYVATWLLDGHGQVIRDQYLDWPCDYDCGQDWQLIGIIDPEHKRGIRWPLRN